MLYKVVLTFVSVDKILKCDHWNASSKPYLTVLLLIFMLYKVVLTFSVFADEILNCTHFGKSRFLVLSCGVFYYAVQDESNLDHSNAS